MIFKGNKTYLHNELREKVIDNFINKNMQLTTHITKLSNEITILKKINHTQIHVFILKFN